MGAKQTFTYTPDWSQVLTLNKLAKEYSQLNRAKDTKWYSNNPQTKWVSYLIQQQSSTEMKSTLCALSSSQKRTTSNM